MEFEFDTVYRVKVESFIYTIFKRNNHWRVEWRERGKPTFVSDARHDTLDQAEEHVRIIALKDQKLSSQFDKGFCPVEPDNPPQGEKEK